VCEANGETLATMYSAEDFADVKTARDDAGRDADNHWVGGYIGDGDAGADNSCSTIGDMWAYWKEKDANGQTVEYIIVDGADVNDGPHSQQGFTSWFTPPGGTGLPFEEIEVSTDCECWENDQNQDATRYAMRLQGAPGNWRWRCNNQPGYAMCQAGPPGVS